MLSLFVLCLCVCGLNAAPFKSDVPTVDELDVPLYLGRWYQTHGSPTVLAFELKNATCVSADYGVYNESTITVYNHQRQGGPTGPKRDISGVAYTTDEPGKLLVDFFLGFVGDYWVMQLGPVSNYDGQELYSYSLVSEPSGRALYVLCRDPEEFVELYEADVLSWLANNGFDKLTNNPVAMYQGSDCLYPELP